MDHDRPSVRASHVGICVSDLSASLAFWCDGLGFTPTERHELDDDVVPGLAEALEVDGPVLLTSQFVVLDGLRVELLAFERPTPTGRPGASRGRLGLTHVALAVRDLDATAARAVAHGGTLLEDTDRDVGVRVVFLADPDGTRVELLQTG